MNVRLKAQDAAFPLLEQQSSIQFPAPLKINMVWLGYLKAY